MESADAELKGLAKAVHEVAIAFRSSNKMAAALRNPQQRAIKLGNLRKPTRLKMLAKTRWNAVTDVLESHSKAREQLIQTLVQNAGKGLVDIDIANKVAEPVLEKHLTYLQTVKKLSKKLQTHGLDIATGQSMLDGVIAAVENGTDGFENCKLNPTKISLAGCADSDKSFVSGVIKIIEKNEGSMTDDEKASCQCLLKPRDAMGMEESGEVPEEMDLLERENSRLDLSSDIPDPTKLYFKLKISSLYVRLTLWINTQDFVKNLNSLIEWGATMGSNFVEQSLALYRQAGVYHFLAGIVFSALPYCTSIYLWVTKSCRYIVSQIGDTQIPMICGKESPVICPSASTCTITCRS